jgi:uncharacterized protein
MKVFKIKKGYFFISLMIILIVFSHLFGCREETYNKIHTSSINQPHEVQFHKEGELVFINKDGNSIVTIDVEIPQTLEEISAGLMFRHALAEKQGMLFEHDKFKARFFWMKNTYIPLDMVFADKTKNIIRIRENAAPLSKELIPIPEGTQYTIEVNGGFCHKYGIVAGDRVEIRSFYL